jgi:hypothetical protein
MTTILIYYIVRFGLNVVYSMVYEYVRMPKLHADFGRSVRLYCYLVLPYILLFTNLMLILVRNKKINIVVVILIYLCFIFWWWGIPILSRWPYRGVPAFCIVSVFYLFDILIIRFIVKKLLQKIVL